MLTHAQARSIITDAWRRVHGRAPSQRELAYAQAIALLETGYGRIGQFARMAEQGRFNWGALQTRPNAEGVCPSGTAPGIDQGNVCFYVFDSDVAAAAQYLRVLTKAGGRLANRTAATLRAMSTGTPEDVAAAMRVAPAYYEGTTGSNEDRIRAYAGAIRRRIGEIGASVPGRAVASAAVPLLVFLGAAGAGYWWWTRRGPGRGDRDEGGRRAEATSGRVRPRPSAARPQSEALVNEGRGRADARHRRHERRTRSVSVLR